MTRWIDLNADLGEGCGDDAAIMQIVTSCNIACGGHAGDADSMRAALLLAKEFGVSAGAHPSYPDRENFGRSNMEILEDALTETLSDQVATLKEIANGVGIKLSHLKPHGALYNYAAREEASAKVIARVTKALLPNGALVGPPNSAMELAARDLDIRFVGEGFADRAYEADGSLRSRSKSGAVLEAGDARVSQAMKIAKENSVQTHCGRSIKLPVKTICLHSDSPGALQSARDIRKALEASGIDVKAPA